MFALPGIILLLGVVYVRPQEFVPALRSIPWLYLGVALALFGWVVDLKLRRSRLVWSPQLGWILGLLAWCMFGLLVRARQDMVGAGIYLGTSFILYFLIGFGTQTLRTLTFIGTVMLFVTIYLSAVGVHQGLQPYGCHLVDESSGDGTGTFDGRLCTDPRLPHECEEGDAEPGAEYRCEHPGLFGTSSIDGRVRYRGPLNDPNELSLAIGIGLPFAFVFFERRKNFGRLLVLIVTLGLVATCTVFSKSRGGQLVFLTVLAVYFIRRFGWVGLLAGIPLAAPMLLLGGRSGEEAESSSQERIGCMYEGMTMFKEHPLLGVGQGQFVEHHTQTAHNSYVLSAAELGIFGMIIWSAVVYMAMKIPIDVLRRLPDSDETRVARSWATALVAAHAGLLVGIFFLSFSYHTVLWIYMGMSAALFAAVQTHRPDWRLRFGWRDLLLVTTIDVSLIVFLFIYTRIKGAP